MKVRIEKINTTDGIKHIVVNPKHGFVCFMAKEWKTKEGAIKASEKKGYTVINKI